MQRVAKANILEAADTQQKLNEIDLHDDKIYLANTRLLLVMVLHPKCRVVVFATRYSYSSSTLVQISRTRTRTMSTHTLGTRRVQVLSNWPFFCF